MKTYTKRQLHKARGIRTWYLRTYEDGRTTYTSMRTTSAKAAQEIVDRLNAARFFPGMVPDSGSAVTGDSSIEIGRAVREFLDNVSSVTPKSLGPYTEAMKQFREWCEGHGISTMQGFGKADANRMVEELSRDFKPVTIRNRATVISLFYRRVGQMEGVTLADPFDGVTMPKVEKVEKDFWTMEQIAAILDHAAEPRLRMAWAFMGYAGLRIHEAVKVADRDIQGGELLVYGKGGKEARLPISERLSAEIALYRAACGGTWAPPAVSKGYSISALSAACRAAGVPEGRWCSNHKLRHSFASSLARSGCPVRVAMALLRHSSSSMTMDVYSHVVGDDLKEWAGKI